MFCRVNRVYFATYGKTAPLVILDELERPDKLTCKFDIKECPDVLRGDFGTNRIDVKGKRWVVSKDW